MNGYPSKSELTKIKKFEGTPRQFVEYVGSIWRNGAGWKLELVESDTWPGRTEWLATFVTGGWSGCEDVIGVVGKTLFSIFFHSKWRRGGLYEYRISVSMIDADLGILGVMPRVPPVSPTTEGPQT